MANRTLRARGLLSTAVTGLAVLGISLAGAPAASASPTASEVIYCVSPRAGDCLHGQDAADWASGVTEWRYQNYSRQAFHGGIADAYRHCIWSGALAQRIGEDRAMTLVTVHELEATDGEDHVQMDMENDRTGVTIGGQANGRGGSDTWGWIMSQCAAKADSGLLTTIR